MNKILCDIYAVIKIKRLYQLMCCFAADKQQNSDATAETDDVTAETGDVTAETGDVTAETGDVMADTGDVTI